MSGKTTSRLIFACLLAPGLMLGCAKKIEQSSTASGSETPKLSEASQSGPQNKSVRIYIDPKTGEPRDPTPEELVAEAANEAQKKEAQAAKSPSEQSQSPEVITPSGASEITLDPSAQRPLKACIDKQGNLKMDHDCSESHGAKR